MIHAYKQATKGKPNETMSHQGGAVTTVSPWEQLNRFLILGTSGGTFYVNETKLTEDNLAVVKLCIDEAPFAVLDMIKDVSVRGLGVSNDPAIVALAVVMTHPDVDVRRSAAELAVKYVCRTGTHWLHFCALVDGQRGWGRIMETATRDWYGKRGADFQVAKYQQRDGWSHKDVLKLSHAKLADPILQDYIFGKDVSGRGNTLFDNIAYIHALAQTKNVDAMPMIQAVIKANRLPREVLPSELLNDPGIWSALLQDMPAHAMIRNLGVMTANGTLSEAWGNVNTKRVLDVLRDTAYLVNTRVHPMAVLVALKQYSQGRGLRGGKTWQPVGSIVDALDDAFYATFASIEPTGKRHLLCVDTSSSMNSAAISGSPLRVSEAAAAMALVTAAREPETVILCVDTVVNPVKLTPKMRLTEVMQIMNFRGGGTYLSAAATEARTHGIHPDVMVYYTDNATGDTDTWREIAALREASAKKAGRDMKVAAVAMTPYNYSVLKDVPWALNIAGFSPDVPRVIAMLTDGTF